MLAVGRVTVRAEQLFAPRYAGFTKPSKREIAPSSRPNGSRPRVSLTARHDSESFILTPQHGPNLAWHATFSELLRAKHGVLKQRKCVCKVPQVHPDFPGLAVFSLPYPTRSTSLEVPLTVPNRTSPQL